jgi:hypothetical protein
MLCGGFSQEKEADDECKNLINSVKNNLKYDIIKIISYKTQVVNGTNYLIKNKIDNENFYFVKIHKSLDNEYKIIDHDLRNDF